MEVPIQAHRAAGRKPHTSCSFSVVLLSLNAFFSSHWNVFKDLTVKINDLFMLFQSEENKLKA